MKTRGMLKATALVVTLGLAAVGCGGDDEGTTADETTTTTAMEETTTTAMDDTTTTEGDAEAAGTIPEVAAEAGSFTTLLELVQAAGLAEALSGEGPFTVFAPTDDAFAAVPEETLNALAEDPQGALADVLKLHVIEGEIDSAAAAGAAGTCVTTLQGGQLKVEEAGDGLTIGGANIVTVDVEASNGVIHVIDSVITAESADC